MGGKSTSTTTQNTTTEPWKVAQPAVQGVLGGVGGIDWNLTGNQREAISKMVGLARAGNPYAPAIDSFAATMLAGGGPDRTGLLSDVYNRYKTDLEGTARGDMLDPNRNPWFADVSNNIASTVTNNLAGLYAASGRPPDGAGSFAQNVGKGVA